jgi:Xaa-Pro dipeptidase
MQTRTPEEMKKIYADRKSILSAYMKKNSITAAVFEDKEGLRSPAVRYYTGHPGDALFIFTENGNSVLCPWDEYLAAEKSVDCKVIPFTNYERSNTRAVKEILSSLKIKGKQNVDISPETPYPVFLQYVDVLAGWDVRCRENSVHDFTVRQRAIKDTYEIECTKEAARIGDLIIDGIEKAVKTGEIRTETDVALFIERECRNNGCERTGFDTLAAGPDRSFAIHAFPGYTAAPWPAPGLSILDFGVVFNGYTSDTTMTIAQGMLSEAQEKQLELVEKAAALALPLYQAGSPIRLAAAAADLVFSQAKRSMPHTLGHGIGLEIHEYPRIAAKVPQEEVFQSGMIVTLEPGLYDPAIGGCRLENDILITENGNEVISHSRIIRI